MKLKQVEIHDFKSIRNEILEINSNQLCLVGKNESGKSSLILATSFLNILDTEFNASLLNKSSESYPNGLPIVIGTFELSKSDYTELLNISKPFLQDDLQASLPRQSENCLLQLKRWGNGFANISVSIIEKNKFGFELSNNIKEIAKFYNQFFENLYPRIQYYENEDLLIEPSTIKELLGDNRKFETFRKLLTIGGCKDFNDLNNPDINFVTTYLSDIEIKLNKIFKKHYKQDQSINIKIAPTFGDRLNLIIQDDSGKSFSIKERSPGFQYYFSFLVNKLHTKEVNKGINTVILLDEPGNSLHPKGAKDLLKSFDDVAESSQILYTTHNPFLAVRNCIDSLLFINKSATEGTKINKKPFLNKYQILRKELGIMLNDSFLIGDINLIVEGNTEKLGFHRIFQFDKYQNLEWMNIYNADGVTNIPQAINYLGKNNLKLSGIVILDSDSEAEGIKKNKAYKHNIKEANWEEIEINTIFNDKNDRTFEDLFPQQSYIDAFNKYCESLHSLDVFNKKYIPFEYKEVIQTPIINTLSTHFKSFLPENSKASITKQDVVRYLLDAVDKLPEKEQKETLSNIFKLTDKIKTSFSKIEKHVHN